MEKIVIPLRYTNIIPLQTRAQEYKTFNNILCIKNVKDCALMSILDYSSCFIDTTLLWEQNLSCVANISNL